jgi:hypothetical protein
MKQTATLLVAFSPPRLARTPWRTHPRLPAASLLALAVLLAEAMA